MLLISWNVNGLRACLNKGFLDFFRQTDADIFCVQETKMQREQSELVLEGYHQFWNSAEKKGYSGTAVFAKELPEEVFYGINLPEHDKEGRVITLSYPDFFLVNAYIPNSQKELARLSYRMAWDDAFRAYLQRLDGQKPVILCGDLNVAHQEIDLKNPKSNLRNAGFTQEERNKLSLLLETGFIDSFRSLYPEVTGAYTWWSYMFNARANNAGWRIDYFITSRRLQSRIEDSLIYPDILGSDHCPVGLRLR